ncbi:Rib/alpha-like domain-containing protein [Pseudoglutamicibacter cumminsii]|uniref:Rib/alpha-like domain-containing protein n=1 Tax=Pseudoglutamicibacter cumminsii TaxID=156979 RepID=UPI0026EF2611|nr:Rib/alpha-like domain-containing protein [Pseudoglutamicibacter cumminsii]
MSVAAVNNTQSAFASENTVEAPAPEAAEDAPEAGEEAPAPDAGEDAPAPDAGEDAPAPDAGEDAPAPDAGEDAPAPDAGEDAPAPDAGEDAPAPDAGEDAPAPDAGEDAPEEDPAATQASLFQVAYAEVTVTEGEVAEVAAPTFTDAESGAAVDAPAGTTFALKSEIAGVNVDEATGAITVGEPATAAAPATNVYEVAVTYPDGSKKTAVATVKVVPTEQAKLYQPEYTEVTVTEGEVAEVAAPKFTDEESGEERDMPEGTTFALNAGEIAGVTVDEETGAITVGEPATAAAPSTLVYEVAVTYPDGSKDVVVATVKVVPTEQAKLYQPEYTEVTVTEGEVAEVAAPKFTDEESGEERDMPEGTTFALNAGEIAGVTVDEETGAITVGEPATAAAPSTLVYEVAVTYPDGSKDVVVATVKVVPTEQAKLYQPEYAPATVERGQVGTIEAPKFTDEETGEERDMPEGTTFALKDAPINGVTINEETGEITVESTYAAVTNVYEVLVTYPDGSSEVVVATIDVIDTPVDEQPGEEEPGEEQPGEEQPGEEQPGEEEPGEEQPGEEQPGEEQPGEEQPGEEQPGEGDLARTGAEVGGLMALMASLIAGAASLFTIRRRKSEQ